VRPSRRFSTTVGSWSFTLAVEISTLSSVSGIVDREGDDGGEDEDLAVIGGPM